MPKVSILVAIYNAEAFLHQCLDSLLAQTLRDIQILCIDDASTDTSLEIARQYAQRDPRVEVIALKQNSGQAHARNQGLKQATGTYICMLDSDDWMSPDALQLAVEKMETQAGTDCVLFHLINVFPHPASNHTHLTNDHAQQQEEEYPMQPFEKLSGQEAFLKSLTWDIHGLYLLKTHIHRQYPYDESAKAYSDDNTTRLHYLHSRQVSCCSGTYFYRQHPLSVTHSVSLRRFDYLKANDSMAAQLRNLHLSSTILSLYENVRWLNLIDTYLFYYQYRHKLSPQDKRYGLSEIKRVWQLIDTNQLARTHRLKFGYIPFRSSWFLFRLQEELYFSLRSLKGRISNIRFSIL